MMFTLRTEEAREACLVATRHDDVRWYPSGASIPVGATVRERWFAPGVTVLHLDRVLETSAGYSAVDAAQWLLDNRYQSTSEVRSLLEEYIGERSGMPEMAPPEVAHCLSAECQCYFLVGDADELGDVWSDHEIGSPFSPGACPLCGSISELRANYVWARCRWEFCTDPAMSDLEVRKQILHVVRGLRTVILCHGGLDGLRISVSEGPSVPTVGSG